MDFTCGHSGHDGACKEATGQLLESWRTTARPPAPQEGAKARGFWRRCPGHCCLRPWAAKPTQTQTGEPRVPKVNGPCARDHGGLGQTLPRAACLGTVLQHPRAASRTGCFSVKARTWLDSGRHLGTSPGRKEWTTNRPEHPPESPRGLSSGSPRQGALPLLLHPPCLSCAGLETRGI